MEIFTTSNRTGYFKTTKKWLEKLNSTTTIVFYDYQQSDKTDYDYAIDYEAVFVEGKLSSIKLIKFETHENAARKKKDIEFEEQLKKHREFIKTWKYKYFVKPYNNIISYSFRKLTKVSYNLSYFFSKIERKIKI